MPSLPPKKKILPILAKDSLKIVIEPITQCATPHEYPPPPPPAAAATTMET